MPRPWPESFPNVIAMSTAERVSGHLDHAKAKAGDIEAAVRLVFELANPSKLVALGKAFPDAIIVPVHAEEATGRNQLPIQFAAYASEITGLEVCTEVVQASRVGRTGKGAWHRLAFRPTFDGEVEPGRRYILLDDIVTGGGSLSELRCHVENQGGEVVAATTLGFAQFSTKLAPSKETILALETTFCHNDLRAFLTEQHIYNGEYRCLTESEARTLLRARSLDAARSRIAEAAFEVLAGLRPQFDSQEAFERAAHAEEGRRFVEHLRGFPPTEIPVENEPEDQTNSLRP